MNVNLCNFKIVLNFLPRSFQPLLGDLHLHFVTSLITEIVLIFFLHSKTTGNHSSSKVEAMQFIFYVNF